MDVLVLVKLRGTLNCNRGHFARPILHPPIRALHAFKEAFKVQGGPGNLCFSMASIFRNGIWFLHGWWNYGKSGFEKASKNFDPKDLEVDLKDQIAIVTGSNSGLGLETSYELAKRGAKVYMLCRDMNKGSAAIEELKSRSDSIADKLFLRKVDVSLQSDIKSFAKEFTEDHVDILVNNAGCMIDGRPLTSEGIEVNFATNVMGPYLLTESLIDKLSKPAREKSIVLTVTSGGMLTQKLEPKDIQLFKSITGIDIYAQNKRQQVELTHHWAEKYKSLPIFFCTAHPGWADTPAVRTSMPDFYAKFHKEFRTAQQGADTIVWAIVSEKARKGFPNGSFFEDRAAVSEHLPMSGTRSTDAERELFVSNLEKLVK